MRFDEELSFISPTLMVFTSSKGGTNRSKLLAYSIEESIMLLTESLFMTDVLKFEYNKPTSLLPSMQ